LAVRIQPDLAKHAAAGNVTGICEIVLAMSAKLFLKFLDKFFAFHRKLFSGRGTETFFRTI
jgi:hypothetical protein